MTINELIERLEEARENLDSGEVEVRLMTQENWPFENGICGLALSSDIAEAASEEDEDEGEPQADGSPILYIVEGRQIGYGSKLAWNVAEQR